MKVLKMNSRYRNKMGTKEELVVNEFKKLCNDTELKHFPELNTLIVTYYDKLNQENKAYFRLKLVAELTNELSYYLLKNRFQAPKSVIDFSLLISKSQSQFRGKLATLQMLAFSLMNSLK